MVTPSSGFNPYLVLQLALRAQEATEKGLTGFAQMQLRECLDALNSLRKDRGDGGNIPAYDQLQELLLNEPIRDIDQVVKAAHQAMPRVCMLAVQMTGFFDPDYTKTSGTVNVVYAVDLSVPPHAMVSGVPVSLFCEKDVSGDILAALETELFASDHFKDQQFAASSLRQTSADRIHEAPELELEDLLDAMDYSAAFDMQVDEYRANPTLFDSSYSAYQALRAAREDIKRGLDESALQKLGAERPPHYGADVFDKAFAKAVTLLRRGNDQGALEALNTRVIIREVEAQRVAALLAGEKGVAAVADHSPSR